VILLVSVLWETEKCADELGSSPSHLNKSKDGLISKKKKECRQGPHSC